MDKHDSIGMVMERTKIELITSINEIMEKNNLPIYLFEIIMKEVYTMVVQQKQQELEAERQNKIEKEPLNLDGIERKDEE